ncbi:MAG: flagellar biosynthetic protein FliO [Pseudomonadales bacterium]|jgi:flagellar protein FliO/FliZ|nr:flagellar biosynthetic protein FliO [Pseudomonadales bacterium]
MTPSENIWQVALALVLIVGLVFLLGYVVRRFQGLKGHKSGQLKIVDSAYLGPKEKLVLVRIADQHVLVGMNAQCITKLAQLDAGSDFSTALDQAKAKT